MTDLQNSVAALIEARKLMDNDLAPLLEQLKDNSIPLDQRWEAYTALVKNNILVSDKIYGDGYINTLGDKITLYDDFYSGDYETFQFIDMYERLMEAEDECQEFLVNARENNLIEWQEQVLASGYSSFTHEW